MANAQAWMKNRLKNLTVMPAPMQVMKSCLSQGATGGLSTHSPVRECQEVWHVLRPQEPQAPLRDWNRSLPGTYKILRPVVLTTVAWRSFSWRCFGVMKDVKGRNGRQHDQQASSHNDLDLPGLPLVAWPSFASSPNTFGLARPGPPQRCPGHKQPQPC